jgi:hypothetical protein
MTTEKPINEWTRADFEALPHRGWNEDMGLLHAIVIIPAEPPDHIHESGYRNLIIVGCIEAGPRCILTECSDALHIEGIGGRGRFAYDADSGRGNWLGAEGEGWTIDCLAVSGFLRLFVTDRIEVGSALSSFEVFSRKKGVKP